MKKLFTLILITTFTVIIVTQTPQKLSYQAVVRNSSGQLVASHAVGMRLSILQGSSTGTPVYVETQTPINGSQVGIQATTEINLVSPSIGIKATSLKMSADGLAELKGNAVKITGSGTTDIDGGIVTIN